MDLFLEYKNDIAFLFARVLLGVLFFFQGYDKIFGLGLKKTEGGVEEALRQTHLPGSLIKTVTVISSFIEFTGGLFLLAGWLVVPSLVFLGINLIVVSVAMSLLQPLWDMRFVWPRIVLVLLLLLLPDSWDRLSLDNIFFRESLTP
ncbi:MAG TPA: DoxX family protein [Bacteroidia bacterium]|nr:DoxX family protein [Bacteroidia bacterium]